MFVENDVGNLVVMSYGFGFILYWYCVKFWQQRKKNWVILYYTPIPNWVFIHCFFFPVSFFSLKKHCRLLFYFSSAWHCTVVDFNVSSAYSGMDSKRLYYMLYLCAVIWFYRCYIRMSYIFGPSFDFFNVIILLAFSTKLIKSVNFLFNKQMPLNVPKYGRPHGHKQLQPWAKIAPYSVPGPASEKHLQVTISRHNSKGQLLKAPQNTPPSLRLMYGVTPSTRVLQGFSKGFHGHGDWLLTSFFCLLFSWGARLYKMLKHHSSGKYFIKYTRGWEFKPPLALHTAFKGEDCNRNDNDVC